jgi:hypothetical protein
LLRGVLGARRKRRPPGARSRTATRKCALRACGTFHVASRFRIRAQAAGVQFLAHVPDDHIVGSAGDGPGVSAAQEPFAGPSL